MVADACEGVVVAFCGDVSGSGLGPPNWTRRLSEPNGKNAQNEEAHPEGPEGAAVTG